VVYFRSAADWLERLSWWRVLLLVIAIIVFGSWLQNSLTSKGGGPLDLNYDVQVTDDGSVRVVPRKFDSDSPTRGQRDRKAQEDIKAAASRLKDFVVVDNGKGDGARVNINKNGLVIDAKDKGDRTRIVVDNDGVHVLEGEAADADAARADAQAKADAEKPVAPVPPVPGMAPSEPNAAIHLPNQVDQDQLREALSQVREDLQDLAEEQRDRKRGNFMSDFVGALTGVLCISAGLLKIEGGRRRKAENRAVKATELAESEQLKRQLSEARMQTMQAQVEPHFLFNTLASIDHLIETDPPRASAMQKNLITYLRNSIPKMREQATTLGRETDLVRSYLDILKMRMDERLSVDVQVPEGLRSATFPPMMLQSLVENAIKHGLEPSLEPGSVSIRADVIDGQLRVTVADTGIGFDPVNARTKGTGLGLTNIRERLALMFDQRARLTVAPNAPRGTVVAIELPYQLVAGGAPSQNTASSTGRTA
jgi:signal transduction histidine kinase